MIIPVPRAVSIRGQTYGHFHHATRGLRFRDHDAPTDGENLISRGGYGHYHEDGIIIRLTIDKCSYEERYSNYEPPYDEIVRVNRLYYTVYDIDELIRILDIRHFKDTTEDK